MAGSTVTVSLGALTGLLARYCLASLPPNHIVPSQLIELPVCMLKRTLACDFADSELLFVFEFPQPHNNLSI